MSHYPLEEIRSRYAALRDLCYLNTGTIGIMSEPVLEKHLDRIARYERRGHAGEADARAGYEGARSAIARTINAAPEEIALNRNATDGINFVLAGMSFPTGSTFLTTDEEHPAAMLPLTHAARRCDGTVRTLNLDHNDSEVLAGLRGMLERQSVAIAVISHVSCETGRRLPIRKICRICREFGVPTLVDGAQSVGQIPVDIEEIGCDFMTGNGHKWLCGPNGTGFLYVQKDRLDLLTPPYVGAGATQPDFDRHLVPPYTESPDWTFRGDAQRYEFGTRNWHLFGALDDAVSELEEIGSEAIQRHVATMSGYLKAELKGRAGVALHTPEAWDCSSGLVTFSVDGWNGVALSRRLWDDYGIIQRRVQIPSGVRISCAHFTSQDDLTRFLDALDELIEAGPRAWRSAD